MFVVDLLMVQQDPHIQNLMLRQLHHTASPLVATDGRFWFACVLGTRGYGPILPAASLWHLCHCEAQNDQNGAWNLICLLFASSSIPSAAMRWCSKVTEIAILLQQSSGAKGKIMKEGDEVIANIVYLVERCTACHHQRQMHMHALLFTAPTFNRFIDSNNSQNSCNTQACSVSLANRFPLTRRAPQVPRMEADRPNSDLIFDCFGLWPLTPHRPQNTICFPWAWRMPTRHSTVHPTCGGRNEPMLAITRMELGPTLMGQIPCAAGLSGLLALKKLPCSAFPFIQWQLKQLCHMKSERHSYNA